MRDPHHPRRRRLRSGAIVIACHCNAVRDDEIRTEVRLGASTVAEVSARCGAAARCGGCRATVEHVIADEVGRSSHVAVVRS